MSAEFTSTKRKREIRDCALKLKELSSLPENQFCADCNYKPAKWCSVNIGCFLCIRCSGIHRSLGVEHSFVKSITLDDWSYELVNAFAAKGGNKQVNALYEAKLESGKISHQSDAYKAIAFITDKYVHKKWWKHLHHHRRKSERHRKRNASAKKHHFRSNEKSKHRQSNEKDNTSVAVLPSDDDYKNSWIKFDQDIGSGILPDEDMIVIDMNEASSNDTSPDLLDCSQLERISLALNRSEHDDEAKTSVTDVVGHNSDADIFEDLQMQQQHQQPLSGKAAILSKYEQRNLYGGHGQDQGLQCNVMVMASSAAKPVSVKEMSLYSNNAVDLNLFQVGERIHAAGNNHEKAAVFDAYKHLDDLMNNDNGYIFDFDHHVS